MTFGREWGIGDFNVTELIETAEMIDSLPFVRLEYVVRYKTIRSGDGFKERQSSLPIADLHRFTMPTLARSK